MPTGVKNISKEFNVNDEAKSPCNYGTAVILCGLFGVLGIHHFYIKNVIHGLIDLGLFILAVVLLLSHRPGLALLVLSIDGIHTIVVFYLLITHQQRDGDGLLVKL